MLIWFCLTEDFVLIQITFKILTVKLLNFLVVKCSNKQGPKHEKFSCVGIVHLVHARNPAVGFFAPSTKVGISLNKSLVSKYSLGMIILFCIDSFLVASDF